MVKLSKRRETDGCLVLIGLINIKLKSNVNHDLGIHIVITVCEIKKMINDEERCRMRTKVNIKVNPATPC